MEGGDGGREFGTYVSWALGVTTALLLILPMIFVVGKATHYSAYSSEGDYDGLAQLKDMRDGLEGDGYSIANTMSTPMLCLLYTSPSPRDVEESRMPSSA